MYKYILFLFVTSIRVSYSTLTGLVKWISPLVTFRERHTYGSDRRRYHFKHYNIINVFTLTLVRTVNHWKNLVSDKTWEKGVV